MEFAIIFFCVFVLNNVLVFLDNSENLPSAIIVGTVSLEGSSFIENC